MLALPIALISYGQAALLGLLQGVTELFPVSSLGHSVILPQLLGWDIHQNDPFFITFLVATHLATALVLLGFFWQDWVRIVRGLGRSLRRREIGDAGPTTDKRIMQPQGKNQVTCNALQLGNKCRETFS